MEARPAAVAVSDGADFGVLGSQVVSAGKNFGRACLARVGCQVGIKVEFWPGRLAGGEDVCG